MDVVNSHNGPGYAVGLAPTPEDLLAYGRGALDPKRFAEVDAWVATQADDVQAQIFARCGDAAGQLASAPERTTLSEAEPFRSEDELQRFHSGDIIGKGGVGIVHALKDHVLARDVAIKRLRPRYPHEPFESYVTRLQAFRREARITARLEHPAIVPVHDIGYAGSIPAFTMKLLDGASLAALVERRRAGDSVDLAQTVEILLRIAEALGYAHAHGVVHRDVKPENVIIGSFGAVYVIDWGLAGEIGPAATEATDGVRVGTPTWMAPEQFGAAPADPRMDVFALGGLLMAVLTGHGPREGTEAPQVNLEPLKSRGLSPGLVAVARRCLHVEPSQRYLDGAAVADDLRRWLNEGLTQAQQPTSWQQIWNRLRRSPRLSTTIVLSLLTLVAASGWEVWHYHYHQEERLHRLELLGRVPLDDAAAVQTALLEVRSILEDHPELAQARVLESRYDAALETHRQQQSQRELEHVLDGLIRSFRIRGPWQADTIAWRDALTQAGLTLDPNQFKEDAEQIRRHPLRDGLLAGVAYLWHARVMDGAGSADQGLANLLTAAAPSNSWAALGRLLQHAKFQAHDLHFEPGPDLETALIEPATANVLLAISGPEERLVRYAQQRLTSSPGEFWPLVVSARAAVQSGDNDGAERAALVAHGAEPLSLWPHLALAYVALARDRTDELLSHVEAGLQANPKHLELLVLKAVGYARSGRKDEAQRLVDQMDPGHLQFHVHHQSGHPMERGVAALTAAGLVIPNAAPEIGPLVPHE